MSLKIKTKLTYGIGLLFALIVLLGGLSVKNIYDMATDTQNILANNYNSLLYARRMLDTLETIHSDSVARAEFEKNLTLQKRNITEVDENAATSRLIRELVQPNEKNEPLKIYADNKECFFQVNYIPILTSKSPGGISHYTGDVILLKNITEFKELDSAKTTFISTISHELNTPISAILMSLKLLIDQRVGNMNGEQRTLVENIGESGHRLLEITGELLKMTQVETGKLQLNPKITKPIELIEYAIKANQVQAERFGCHIEVEYPEKMAKKHTVVPFASKAKWEMAVGLLLHLQSDPLKRE